MSRFVSARFDTGSVITVALGGKIEEVVWSANKVRQLTFAARRVELIPLARAQGLSAGGLGVVQQNCSTMLATIDAVISIQASRHNIQCSLILVPGRANAGSKCGHPAIEIYPVVLQQLPTVVDVENQTMVSSI